MKKYYLNYLGLQLTLMFYILLFLISHKLEAQNCDELIHFRDVELYKEFDLAFKKYELNQDAINDMKRIREETLDEKEWGKLMSTGTAITDGGLATAIIAKNIQITCNLISGLLKTVPSADLTATAIEKTSLTAERTYKAITLGKSLKSLVEEDAEKLAYKEVLSKISPLGKVVKTAWDYSEGVKEMIELPKDRDKLKSEVTRILDMLENAVAKYQKEVENSSAKIAEINNIIIGITKYLNENCKSAIKKDEPSESANRNLAQNSKKATVISTENNLPGNSFYIFLVTTISIKPQESQFSNLQPSKKLYIISSPFLHVGSLNDELQSEKEIFLKVIKEHFINNPEYLKKVNSLDFYDKVEIHYGKPYSQLLLRSSSDAQDAINDYKNSIKNLFTGISPFEFVEL